MADWAHLHKGTSLGHPEDREVAQEGSALVETQAWREQVERVREALTSPRRDGWYGEAIAVLDALTAQIEELQGTSHQGHAFGPHRFSWHELLLMFRAMGGDEAVARMTTQIEELERELLAVKQGSLTIGERGLLFDAHARAEAAERDLASSQQAALLLHKRVEEMQRKVEAYDAARAQVKREGFSRAEYVLRAEAAEQENERLREALEDSHREGHAHEPGSMPDVCKACAALAARTEQIADA